MKKGQRRKDATKRNKARRPVVVRPNAHKKSKQRLNPTFGKQLNNLIGADGLSEIISSAGNVIVLNAVRGCTLEEKIIIASTIEAVLIPLIKGLPVGMKQDIADKMIDAEFPDDDDEDESADDNDIFSDKQDGPYVKKEEPIQ